MPAVRGSDGTGQVAGTPESGVSFIQWEVEFQFNLPIGPQSELPACLLLGSTERTPAVFFQ